ncbi:hypothetical protein IAU59_005824 [Kwoniella sp. CBS 9459]
MSTSTSAQLGQTAHAILLLPFTPSLLQNPSALLPIIASTLSQAAIQSFTVFFTTLGNSTAARQQIQQQQQQLYATLRKEPIRHFVLFQRFLCRVYTALVYAQMRAARPLMDVEVHFDGEDGDYHEKLFRMGRPYGDVQVILADDGVSIPSHLDSLLSHLPTHTIPSDLTISDPQTTLPATTSSSSQDPIEQIPTSSLRSTRTGASSSSSSCAYPVVALGGTFDHLHAAHKLLLHLALFLASHKIIVGVMSDSLLGSKSDAALVQKLPERLDGVQRFLLRLGGTFLGPSTGAEPPSYTDRAVLDFVADAGPRTSSSAGRIEVAAAEITDALGPTRYDPDIQALVVSRETVSGGKAVNATRKEKGLCELDIWVVDVIGLPPPPSSTTNAAGSKEEGVIKEMKMGSTGIRRWIAEHPHGDSP